LLDDVAGASLVGGFAWSQWTSEWTTPAAPRRRGRRMEGVCTGFQPGSRALDEEGFSVLDHRVRPVEALTAGPDPLAWHALPEVTGVSMRRSRRIDVHVADGAVVVDSFFQDSATTPANGRIAVHEYRLSARAEAGVLTEVAADPRVLPYLECPLATRTVDRMVGTPVGQLRAAVLERLKGTAGCTHLNDALRALAEIEVLAAPLEEEAPCT
ncbi:DUF2889 domain-containing protein, partial [Pseudonocardia pini]|uniref:DUF2889 domain-containing protein n=1 Tax=Pseudonocardia pini TaxID=2758030 RepID=UPI0015F01D6A